MSKPTMSGAQARSDDRPRPRRIRRVPAAPGLAGRTRTSPSTSISTSRAAAKSSLANGDPVSEGMLNDIGVAAYTGRRVPLVESVFEYGSRRGVWRVLDIFADHSVAVSILGVARALEQNPELAQGLREPRARDRQPRLSLDRLRRRPRRCRAPAHSPGRRYPDGADRRAAARLDDRPAGAQHAAIDRRGRRLSLRPRLARR